MSHIYEVKKEGGSEMREADELACDLIAQGTRHLKKEIPHAATSLDAVEHVAKVIREAVLDGVARGVTVTIRPESGTIDVVTLIEKPDVDGGVHQQWP